MIIKDSEGNLWKTGLKLDYTPSRIEASILIKPKEFFCGRSFFCMIDGNKFILKVHYFLRGKQCLSMG